MAAEFTHLHLHTDYSLLDGACDVDKLAGHLSKIGQTAAAMTDHGNIFGAVHFFDAMQKKGLKPILGCELYICKNDDHRAPFNDDKYNHLLVLAENEAGYRNLVRLTSEAALHGFYRKPRVSKDFLAKHSEGLIGFSGCLAGEVNQQLMAGKYDEAKRAAGQFEEMFGKGNFFLEIQDHGLEPDKGVCDALFKMEKDLDIPLIATNDSHYVAADDSRAHEILLCVQTAGSMNDPNRFKFDTQEFYIKSAEEMMRTFAHAPEVCTRTMQFVDRCNLKLTKVDNPFPAFPVPEGMSLDDYFEQVCREGFRKRLDTAIAHLRERGLLRRTMTEYEERLQREIDCIKQMKFPGYFMIVWDFIRYAKEQGIPVGPGRGSAAGSLVAYVMEITDIDPLQNELLFERFLNPERISMPDIDIDFCMNRRGEVIDYVRRKYGADKVAQIITFGTMAAKSVVRDVGRVLGLPYTLVDKVAKTIPAGPDVTLPMAAKESPALIEAMKNDKEVERIIEIGSRLEGLSRHAGMHAAGVVITPEPVTNYVPLYRTNRDEIVTQYDWRVVEKMGLLKIDFLGLRTLTVIDDAIKSAKAVEGVSIDIDTLPLDDPEVFRLFQEGRTKGVFQFESGGMVDVLRKSRPTQFEDLAALNALYRPGALDAGMVDVYVKVKTGAQKPRYLVPIMKELLEETYGVIVYQEQILQIAQRVAGYTLGHADLLRKAMGKKDAAVMAAERSKFVDGAAANGYDKKKANEIFDYIEPFARYGFNKSHSVAYALVAYQTAWLKVHFPRHFMAALMTSEMDRTDFVVKFINEAKSMGIEVLPPDVNESNMFFTVVGPNIRFGLGAVKGVGEGAIESVLQARRKIGRYTSLLQFCEEVDLRACNKKALEALIKSGSFDFIGSTRKALFDQLESTADSAQRTKDEKDRGQSSLFGVAQTLLSVPSAQAPQTRVSVLQDEWPDEEML